MRWQSIGETLSPGSSSVADRDNSSSRINAIADLLVLFVCLFSLGLSILESRLNADPLHWGLMYGNAADFNLGLVPYNDIFIAYGLVTTWIQALALRVMGNSLTTIGIITGIFYSLNLYLSYVLWRKMMSKFMSAISVLLMFIVHPGIFYPWSNYFSYTFLLFALILLVARSSRSIYFFAAGLFWAVSVLARQSSIITIIPIELFLIWLYSFALLRENKTSILKSAAMLHVGAASIFLAFYFYLLSIGATKSWYLQSVEILGFYGSNGTSGMASKIQFIFQNILQNLLSISDFRLTLYSILFFTTGIFWVILLKILIFNVEYCRRYKELSVMFLLSTVALFGFMLALPLYEVFRLQSSSSLGFGFLVLGLNKLYLQLNTGFNLKLPRFTNPKLPRFTNIQIFGLLFCVSLLMVLTFSFLKPLVMLKLTSSKGRGAIPALLSGKLHSSDEFAVFQGKLYPDEKFEYYGNIKKLLEHYGRKSDYYLVNFSVDAVVPYLSNHLKRSSISPFYSEELSSLIFQDESKFISKLLSDEKAVLVFDNVKYLPDNYCPIYLNNKPNLLHVAVPRSVADACKQIPPDWTKLN